MNCRNALRFVPGERGTIARLSALVRRGHEECTTCGVKRDVKSRRDRETVAPLAKARVYPRTDASSPRAIGKTAASPTSFAPDSHILRRRWIAERANHSQDMGHESGSLTRGSTVYFNSGLFYNLNVVPGHFT